MALALYRKYRPATFGEVVGQEHVTAPLRTALAAGRINHAYLFSGPRGCGKTSSARILARSLNCAHGPTADPCGECESCVALAPEGPGSVDVIELDAASHGGVDDTRELRDRAVFAPANSRYRIFVIDEAHMVTPQGFNALLKIVEEPPEHLIFVFATTEPDKVLTTIRSRTHHYPFRLVPPGSLRELMERICGEEGVQVDPAVYPLAIRAGGGSVRDTLSIMDQLLAGAGEEGITYERAVALLGVTDVALIDAMVDALAAGDHGTVYGTVDQLVEAGHDPRRFASDLLDRLRNLVLVQAVPEASQRGLVHGSGDEITTMHTQAEQLGAATLSRFADIVHAGLSEMRGATAPRLQLELMCARMLLPTVSADDSALLQRLEQVERRMSIAGPPRADGPQEAGDQSAPAAGAEDAAPGRRVFQRPSDRAAEQGESASAPAQPQAEPQRQQPQAEPQRQSAAAATGASDAAPSDTGAAAAPAQETPTPQPEPQPTQPAQSAQSAQEAAETSEAAPEPAASSSGRLDAAAVRQVWSELLRAVAERNRPTQALLLNATVQELHDNTLVLSMPTNGLLKQFAQERRIGFVRDALRAVLGGEWDVQCVEAGQQPAAKQSTTPAASRPSGDQNQAASAAWTAPAAERGGDSSGGGSSAQQAAPEGRGNSAPSAASQPDPPAGDAARRDSGEGGGSSRSNGSAPSTADSDVPPPPEPPSEPADEEPPPEDVGPAPSAPAGPSEQETGDVNSDGVLDASTPRGVGGGRDPHEAAVELFASELGARRIDDA